MKICQIIIFLALGMSCFRISASSLPNDVDLKAAYCLEKIRQVAQIHLEISAHPPNDKFNQEQLSFLRAERNKATSDLNRIESYIVPRLKYLDLQSITLAMGRHKADSTSMGQCIKTERCPSQLNSQLCWDNCNKETSGAGSRLKTCSDLDWLPF